MIESEEKHDVYPVCPHCSAEIKKIWYRGIETVFGKKFIYFCSLCKKSLGVTHRKGFWMG